MSGMATTDREGAPRIQHSFDGKPCVCGKVHRVKQSDRAKKWREGEPRLDKLRQRWRDLPNPPMKVTPLIVMALKRAVEIARAAKDTRVRLYHLETAMLEIVDNARTLRTATALERSAQQRSDGGAS